MELEAAKGAGAVMLFGEKYGDRVRVLTAADSVELCGGTHVGNTGNIGVFKILTEASAAAGIRRIEAVCGPRVVRELRAKEDALEEIARELKAPAPAIVERIRQLKTELKTVKDAKAKAVTLDRKEAWTRVQAGLSEGKDGVFAALAIPGFPVADAKDLTEEIRRAHPNFGVAIVVPGEGDVAFFVAVGGNPLKRVKAGDVAKALGGKLGGGGGGRPDFAQGQGKDSSGLDDAVAAARAMLVG
jgi:alanyl-tRNA synthetase